MPITKQIWLGEWLRRTIILLILTVWSCASDSDPLDFEPVAYVNLLAEEPASDFKKARGPLEFHFPVEHGVHPDYLLEWWYFTGFLKSEDKKEYGYQLTFFRYSLTPEEWRSHAIHSTAFKRSGILMGHLAVTDVYAKKYWSYERLSREGAGLSGINSDDETRIWLEEWVVQIHADGTMSLTANSGVGKDSIAIELELQTDTPPILHGDRGYSRKGKGLGQANYYYSLIHLETQGTIQVGQHSLAVKGTSWMDHEWGTSALPEDSLGWDWFGIQFEDKSALMAASIRLPNNETEPSFVSSLYTGAGKLHKLDVSQVEVEVTEYWQSPSTGIVYPAAWNLTVPSQGLNCQVEPLVADQEFKGFSVYWEGLVAADCLSNGVAVSGHGYVELTGYSKVSDA